MEASGNKLTDSTLQQEILRADSSRSQQPVNDTPTIASAVLNRTTRRWRVDDGTPTLRQAVARLEQLSLAAGQAQPPRKPQTEGLPSKQQKPIR